MPSSWTWPSSTCPSTTSPSTLASAVRTRAHQALERERQRGGRVRVVTPEYNYGPPPSLLNALDYVYKEWNYKSAAFVSYGGVSGGLRAVQIEKHTLTTLKMVPIVEAVTIQMVAQHMNEVGSRRKTCT